MKKISYFLVIAGFLISCGGEQTGSKQEQLDSLLKQQSELNEKIKTLRAELNNPDDNTASKLVTVGKLVPEPFRHYVEVQAKVDVDESVSVSPRTQGTVNNILVNEGDQVSKGQVLATLDDQVMQQTLEEVQTQYEFANNIYQKQKNLWDQKIGSEVQYLTAKNNKESLEKRLASVTEQWNMTRIKSPVSGTIDNVHIKIGQSVMPGMPASNVVNLTGMKVEGEVGESYASKIKKGDEVVLYFPDMQKEVKSKVSFTSKAINTLNRTFDVEVPLTGKIEGVSPNMIVVMKIVDYQNDEALVLPVDVIQRSGDGYYVMVAGNTNGKMVATRKKVTLGNTYNGKVEVLTGLAAADPVIITGYRDLNEGQLIRTN